MWCGIAVNEIIITTYIMRMFHFDIYMLSWNSSDYRWIDIWKKY